MSYYDRNDGNKNQDREFALKVIQTAFGILLTIGLLLAGYKILSVSIGIVNINFSHSNSTVEPQSNSNAGNVDSNGSKPQIQIPDPKEFIRYYFGAITSQRNYDYLWSLQTNSFHQANGSYSDYVSYWNTVDDINIKSIDLYDQTRYSVRCRVKMDFYKNGQSTFVDVYFYLMYDNGKQSWVFDAP